VLVFDIRIFGMSATTSHHADLQDVRTHALRVAETGGIEAALDLLLELLASARGSNDARAARLHTVLRALYGRSSEKVSIEQLRLAFAQSEEGVPQGAVPPEGDTPSLPDGDIEQPKKRPKGHGRRPLPKNLPQETKEVPASAEDRICSACGHERKSDGMKATSYLEFRPASFFILNVAREKMTCPHCSEPPVVAESDAHFDSGRPGPGLVAKIIVDKAADGMPLERQSKAILRLGISLSPSTLGEWFGWGCDLLAPLANRLFGLSRTRSYLQADDTGLKVLDPAKKPAVKRGHLWCFVGYDSERYPTIAFRYAPSWQAEHADGLLKGFKTRGSVSPTCSKSLRPTGPKAGSTNSCRELGSKLVRRRTTRLPKSRKAVGG
jgi:transposase